VAVYGGHARQRRLIGDGVPEPYFLLSGESAPEPETEEEIVRPVKVEILRGRSTL